MSVQTERLRYVIETLQEELEEAYHLNEVLNIGIEQLKIEVQNLTKIVKDKKTAWQNTKTMV